MRTERPWRSWSHRRSLARGQKAGIRRRPLPASKSRRQVRCVAATRHQAKPNDSSSRSWSARVEPLQNFIDPGGPTRASPPTWHAPSLHLAAGVCRPPRTDDGSNQSSVMTWRAGDARHRIARADAETLCDLEGLNPPGDAPFDVNRFGANLHPVAWRLVAPTPLVSFVGSSQFHQLRPMSRPTQSHREKREPGMSDDMCAPHFDAIGTSR